MCPKIIIVQKVIQTQTIAQIINVSMTKQIKIYRQNVKTYIKTGMALQKFAWAHNKSCSLTETYTHVVDIART